MNAYRLILVCLLVGVTLAACVTPPLSMDTPDGFARWSDEGQVRAISPEGVVVRARTVENDPPQNLEFWVEVLERQLEESGYLLVEKSEFETGTIPGVLLEWLAPVNDDDWIYLTAISVGGTQIAIVEAAGPTTEYQDHRSAIWASLESIRFGGDESGVADAP